MASKPIYIPNLAGGVNRGAPRDQISINQSTNMANMIIVDGVVQKRTGYAAGTDTSLTGTPFYGGYHYQDGISGLKEFWAIVAGKAWSKTNLTDGWDDRTNSMNIQTGANQYVTFTEVVNFSDYKNYLIVCQNHTNPLTALNGTLGSDAIVWYANSPTGNLTALVGAGGYNASGETSNYVHHRAKQAISFADRLFLLNTYENYTGTSWGNFFYRVRWSSIASFTTYADWDPYFTCYISTDTASITDDNQSVISDLGVTIVADTLIGQTIYVSGTGTKPGNYVIVDNDTTTITLGTNCTVGDGDNGDDISGAASIYLSTTSTAGYQDLRDGFGAIIRGEILGTTLVLYLERAIYNCFHTSSVTSPFSILRMIDNISLMGPRLVATTPYGHFFVGNDRNIWQYEGGKSLTKIGPEVGTELFDNMNRLSAADTNYLIRRRGFAVHLSDIHCVGFYIPTGTTADATSVQYPDTMYVYNYETNKWYDKWTFANEMMGYGVWDSPASQKAEKLPIFGDATATNCKTYLFDYTSANDGSTAITGSIETEDMIIDVGKNHQIMDVWFDAKGAASSSSVTVATKVDDGSWDTTNAQAFTLGSTWNSYHARFNVTGYALKLKFYDATSGKRFFLGQIKVIPNEISEV